MNYFTALNTPGCYDQAQLDELNRRYELALGDYVRVDIPDIIAARVRSAFDAEIAAAGGADPEARQAVVDSRRGCDAGERSLPDDSPLSSALRSSCPLGARVHVLERSAGRGQNHLRVLVVSPAGGGRIMDVTGKVATLFVLTDARRNLESNADGDIVSSGRLPEPGRPIVEELSHLLHGDRFALQYVPL